MLKLMLKQLTTRVNGLRKLTYKADVKTKLMIANGIFMSKLSYGLAMRDNCQGYLRQALQVTQLNSARAVCSYRSFYWSRQRLLKSCNWLSVNQLYWQQVLMTTHKILLSGKPVNVHNRMMTRHNVVTRAATGVSRGFGNLVMRSSFNHSVTTYNNLPAKIRETTSLARFKSQLRCWVEQNIDM